MKHIQVELIQSSWAEMDNTNERHLCEMVLDWLRATDMINDIERLTEKVNTIRKLNNNQSENYSSSSKVT